ncbi:MAG: 3-deoxy-manno-octulosonate cytidylyltransferase [Flavobacteriaceae bacterium]|nr:3-deoxy-manno-octulosonate cytidylyltransferase [Flavobacteriaceae bacterium]|tara:strand:+ start:6278 stop:7048 length:771 start_codon:yes stop_codon:yes gene_type:complete
MNIIGIIPSRMASSRFPNKPMVEILGMPMIGHCYKRSSMCSMLNDVYVATCDKEIFNYINSIGGKAIMTSDQHERASDRTAEAMLKIEKQTKKKIDIVVLLQGDEPMTTPKMIEYGVKPLIDDSSVNITNLFTDILKVSEFEDPNEVKVIVDNNSNAIYFSREPIPSMKKGISNVPMYKQVCVIPFRRDFLIKYNEMEQTNLEIIESIDMLRLIENGIKIKMVYIDENNFSVDTKQDLINVIHYMKNDKLVKKYLK